MNNQVEYTLVEVGSVIIVGNRLCHEDMIQKKMLVSSPNLYDFDFGEFKAFNILSNEAHLTMFKKMLNLLYFDFKSHYPTTFITRNLSKGTLFGRIEDVICKGVEKPIFTRNAKYKDEPIYKEHMGGLTLAMANNNIISYASKASNLPSLTELADMFVPLDSEPLIKPIPQNVYEAPVPNKYHKLCSLLSKINQIRFTKTDEESVEKDNKMFMFTNGDLVYLGTLVEYRYREKDLIDCTTLEGFDRVNHNWYYGSFTKKYLVASNDKCNKPKNKRFDIKGEWKHLDNEVVRKISECKLFGDIIEIDGYKMLVADKTFYYPIEHKLKQLDGTLAKGKQVFVSDLQYRREILKDTAKWEFKYYIEFEDVVLDITQQMQTVNL